VFRGTDKGVWSPIPWRSDLPTTTDTLPDVPEPPPRYYYRVAGASCGGFEGP